MKAKTYSEKLLNPKWQKKRLEILQRDNFTCKLCGDTENTLNVHHKYYDFNKQPWDYNDDVLITLCKDCHEYETDHIKFNIEVLNKTVKKNMFSVAIQNLDISVSKLSFYGVDATLFFTWMSNFDERDMIDVFNFVRNKAKQINGNEKDDYIQLMENEDNSPFTLDYIP